jgi:oligoribonuclease NrnB/cAMP/cGMP phosphodiesterase (DHH superfamily)
MKRTKLIESKELFIFKSKISIYIEDNIYFFESNNQKLSYFLTHDFMEATSALMKLHELFNEDDIWDIKINDDMRKNIDFKKSLYWLTGGYNEWVLNKSYKYDWEYCSDIFYNEYKYILKDIMKSSKTLNDVREGFLKEMNLPTLYEFSLKNNLV